jgi:hypothetical protein
MNQYHKSHDLEWRDSSHYEFVCIKCNTADTTGGPGKLAEPCPVKDSEGLLNEHD